MPERMYLAAVSQHNYKASKTERLTYHILTRTSLPIQQRRPVQQQCFVVTLDRERLLQLGAGGPDSEETALGPD